MNHALSGEEAIVAVSVYGLSHMTPRQQGCRGGANFSYPCPPALRPMGQPTTTEEIQVSIHASSAFCKRVTTGTEDKIRKEKHSKGGSSEFKGKSLWEKPGTKTRSSSEKMARLNSHRQEFPSARGGWALPSPPDSHPAV